MKRSFAGIKSVGFVLWHAKHELFHILFGLMWAWALRELWQQLNPRWIVAAVVGSLLPDIDHLYYFLTYGRRDPYTRTIITYFKNKEWRVLTTFIEKGHKQNTKLTFHNYYVMTGLFVLCLVCYSYDWRTGVVLFGAMITHYTFDIFEDILLLGHVNQNWKRWGRGQKWRAKS